MKIKKLITRYKTLNTLIVLTLLLIAFAALYFLYYRQRSQAFLYASVTVMRPVNIPISAPYNWVPYWIANSININDVEKSTLGSLNAIVLDKTAYEGQGYGQYVYLLLKINSVKDRSGVYLYKNKPLVVGAILDLKLSNTQTQAMVTYLGTTPPDYKYKKIILSMKGRSWESWVVDSIKEGNEIKDSKGKTIVKITNVKSGPAEVRSDSSLGQAKVSYDQTRKDFTIKVELVARDDNGTYYFEEGQKVKVAESLYLTFAQNNLSPQISSIDSVLDL